MIDHKTRMLAVDLQAALGQNDGEKIMATMNAIVVRLGGQELPRHWPSTLQVAYLLALIIQNVPGGVLTPMGEALPMRLPLHGGGDSVGGALGSEDTSP